MTELIKFLKEQKVKETGAFSKGVNKGLNIAISAIKNPQICPTIEQPQWISVEERLPKGGEIVFCNTNNYFEVLQWDARADAWVGMYRSYWKEYVTHWMPLPEPPKGDE